MIEEVEEGREAEGRNPCVINVLTLILCCHQCAESSHSYASDIEPSDPKFLTLKYI